MEITVVLKTSIRNNGMQMGIEVSTNLEISTADMKNGENQFNLQGATGSVSSINIQGGNDADTVISVFCFHILPDFSNYACSIFREKVSPGTQWISY